CRYSCLAGDPLAPHSAVFFQAGKPTLFPEWTVRFPIRRLLVIDCRMRCIGPAAWAPCRPAAATISDIELPQKLIAMPAKAGSWLDYFVALQISVQHRLTVSDIR